jgi:transcriptional regulator with XRE-family HTH domain
MSFRFDIGMRARRASRMIGAIRSDLIAAVVSHTHNQGLSHQQFAEVAGVGRRDLNRYLSGEKELTLRSISDIALALNKEVHLELRDPDTGDGCGSNRFSCDQMAITPVARQLPRDAMSSSSSRAMRTFFARTCSYQDE